MRKWIPLAILASAQFIMVLDWRVIGALVGVAVLALYRRVLAIPQRPSWPPAPGAVTPAEAKAATEAYAARPRPGRRGARLRLVDGGDDRALGRRRGVLPSHLRGRRGRDLVGAHPHVRLEGGRGRDADGRSADAEAGGRRRGAGDRRRLRLQALRGGAGDVHGSRGGRGARSSSTTSHRSSAAASSPTASGSPGAAASSAGSTIASCTSSTGRSRGSAAQASRITSRTAASTT